MDINVPLELSRIFNGEKTQNKVRFSQNKVRFPQNKVRFAQIEKWSIAVALLKQLRRYRNVVRLNALLNIVEKNIAAGGRQVSAKTVFKSQCRSLWLTKNWINLYRACMSVFIFAQSVVSCARRG